MIGRTLCVVAKHTAAVGRSAVQQFGDTRVLSLVLVRAMSMCEYSLRWMNSVLRVWCVSVAASVVVKNFVLCLCVCSVRASAACWGTLLTTVECRLWALPLGDIYLCTRSRISTQYSAEDATCAPD